MPARRPDDAQPLSTTPPLGPVPEDNRPGHRPRVDQDKPTGPPPRPPGSVPRTTRFPFRFDWPVAAANLLVGVMPRTTDVEVGEEHLTVRFGTWRLRTPLTNIEGATVTGPFAFHRVAGPPHLSFTDRGVTFATTTRAGVCVRFVRPVPAIEPVGLLTHPAATITVEDPEGFVEELEAAVRRAA